MEILELVAGSRGDLFTIKLDKSAGSRGDLLDKSAGSRGDLFTIKLDKSAGKCNLSAECIRTSSLEHCT